MSKVYINMGEEFLERRNRIIEEATDHEYAESLKSASPYRFARYHMMEAHLAEDRKFAVRYVEYLTGEQVWSEEAMADWKDW